MDDRCSRRSAIFTIVLDHLCLGDTRAHNTCMNVPTRVGLASWLLLSSVAHGASELLSNASFEQGNDTPIAWHVSLNGGSLIWTEGGAHSGARALRLGSDSGGWALASQSVSGFAGSAYSVRGWARLHSGQGRGELKLEFRNAGGFKLAEYKRELSAPGGWQRFFIVGESPTGTATVSATVVGLDGGMLEFDDLSLTERDDNGLEFDLSQRAQTFHGFGAQVWAYGATPEYPNLASLREQALADFNIRYIRLENYFDDASWDDMRALRSVTDALQIQWLYMIWAAPAAVRDGNGLLRDVNLFARWWAAHVRELHLNGVPVELIELMNEPDSGGAWSTGISHAQYNRLVKRTRRYLDQSGLGQVGIVGPGTSSTSWSAPDAYINALDVAAIAALAGWSTHNWDDDRAELYPQGATAVEGYWPDFAAHASSADETKPRFVTEYATKINSFEGVSYRPPDNSPWDDSLVFPYHNATNSMPYAVQVFENSLALLNAQNGAQVLMLWQLVDEPHMVLDPAQPKGWGLIDLWGVDKPVAGALRTLTKAVREGAEVVRAPDQSFNSLYVSVLVDDAGITLAASNSSAEAAGTTIRLIGGPDELSVIDAIAFERTFHGDPALGESDLGAAVSRPVTLDAGPRPREYSLQISLPAVSTLVVTLAEDPQ